MKTELEQLKELWKKIFNDEDAFIRLYFDKRYTPENTDVHRDGERIVAQLQRIAYPFLYKSFIMNMAYVSGVCTDEDYRNKGIMRQLMYTAHRKMYDGGVHIATLIPAENWLFDYYGKMGYAPLFAHESKYVTSQTFTDKQKRLPVLEMQVIPTEEFLFSEAHDFHTRQLRKKTCAVLHTPEDMDAVLSDLNLASGKIHVGKRDNEIVALAFCAERAEEVYVLELISCDQRMSTSMKVELLKIYDGKKLHIFETESLLASPFGMLRIINAEELLRFYALAHPEKQQTFVITGDEDIAENNAVFHISAGQCKRLKTATPDAAHCDIRQLANDIFDKTLPYMSLMMN